VAAIPLFGMKRLIVMARLSMATRREKKYEERFGSFDSGFAARASATGLASPAIDETWSTGRAEGIETLGR
jgi:hypothetical protein